MSPCSLITYPELCALCQGHDPHIPVTRLVGETVLCYAPAWAVDHDVVLQAFLARQRGVWQREVTLVLVTDVPKKRLLGEWRALAQQEEVSHARD